MIFYTSLIHLVLCYADASVELRVVKGYPPSTGVPFLGMGLYQYILRHIFFAWFGRLMSADILSSQLTRQTYLTTTVLLLHFSNSSFEQNLQAIWGKFVWPIFTIVFPKRKAFREKVPGQVILSPDTTAQYQLYPHVTVNVVDGHVFQRQSLAVASCGVTNDIHWRNSWGSFPAQLESRRTEEC